jgi:hypothetical protein
MKLLITESDLKTKSAYAPIPLECEVCHLTFYKPKNLVLRGLKGTRSVSACSKLCKNKLIGHRLSKLKNIIKLNCNQCNKQFERYEKDYNKQNIKLNKKHFCSRRCVSIWTAKNGDTSRSKFEKWIEDELTKLYPTLLIKYNDRETLNGLELDVLIPQLNLAFEFNGIYHYEPIYGEDRFSKVKLTDGIKFQDCINQKISLCIIDISKIKRFKPERERKFLDIIKKIIQEKLERLDRQCSCS